ncbi:MAG: hypothetical protein OEM38_00460 [Gammaproteobacteria bacterium]|nr:hypothetical protein [Gammaproteobacteria bacterium]
MKITSSNDDTLIGSMIDNCVRYGEGYTGRDFSIKSWKLLIDTFSSRIHLSRMTVDTVTTIKHLVSNVLTTVSSADYYLKNNASNSEILLIDGASWPTDTDIREQAIEIEFATTVSMDQSVIESAIKKHVSYMYFNRGDCDVGEAARLSGAMNDYTYYRIPRV